MLHYSPRTAEAYLAWVRRFIAFHGMRHPKDLERSDLEAFLTYLATRRNVSASTQNQALSAVLFLYRKVLGEDAKWIEPPERAHRPKRLPVVLSRDEVALVLGAMTGTPALVARLLYGSGLRLLEALTLRVKDVDCSRNEILVRNAKGQKDRRTVLPESVRTDLQAHLSRVRRLHETDLTKGFGRAPSRPSKRR
jgi:integrase